MTCARSPSRGFAAHLVLHSPFPAAARPQGRILSIALQQVGDDKHTAGGGGRQQDRIASSGMQWSIHLISRRSASPPQRRQVCTPKIANPKMGRGPTLSNSSPKRVHRESTCGGRHHRRYSYTCTQLYSRAPTRRDREVGERTLWPSRARGDLSLLKAASYVDTLRYGGRDTVAARTLAHALTQRTRETPCRWRRGGMCTARSPSARAPNC